MPALVNCGGDDSRGSLFSKDQSLFQHLAPNVDLYSPARKRSRVTAPFIFGGENAAEPKNPSSSIHSLPDECLFEIFRRLGRPQERSVSACVSKRWLSLLSTIRPSEVISSRGDSPTALKKPLPDLNEAEAMEEDEDDDDVGVHLTRSLDGIEATDNRLAAMSIGVAGRGGLRKLIIRGSNPSRGVTDLGLSAIARGCPSLRALTMWKVPFATDAGLSEIAEGCSMLEKLNLRECPLISDEGLLSIAHKCPNLRSLTIEACAGIGDEALQAIGRHCPKLSAVSLNNCVLITDEGISRLLPLASSTLTKIKLDNLNIGDVSLGIIGYYGKALTDLSLIGLQNVNERGFWVMGSALGMVKLESLTIISCRGATDVGLRAIANGSPSLKKLSLRRCCYPSDAGLKAFIELEFLELEECIRVTLAGILGCLMNPKLKSVALVKCFGIKDMGPNSIPSSLVTSSLESLTIRDCPGFTSRSLVLVGKICQELKEIDLGGIISLTDAGILPLIANRESRLTKVNLGGCVNVTDAVVFALAKQHGGSLEWLNLDGCKNLTDRSLLAISDCCFVLEDLNVSRCAITDYGVAAMASARRINLQMLSLAGCSNLTQKCLPLLGNMGESLMEMNLQGCSLLSSHAISLLEGKLFWCDILS